MKQRKFIATTLKDFLNESSTELVKKEIENALNSFGGRVEGGFLNKKQAEDLQKDIDSNYIQNGIQTFGQDNNDIRQKMYNYEHPLAEKDINGINLRITDGLIEGDSYSGDRRKTFLLYADGKIVGKFYSVGDIKKVIKYIEDNLIKNMPYNKTLYIESVKNVDILEERLITKLLSIGGVEVKLGLDSEEEQNRMLNDGRIYSEKVNFVSGVSNQCHRNVSDKYNKTSKNGFKIVSGYALSDGIWVQHSWGFYRNSIIETTKIKFDNYYGYELTIEESNEFCFSNY